MSDRPLFQNTDGQEAAYDPEGRNALEEPGQKDTPIDNTGGTVTPGAAGAMTSGAMASTTGSAASIAGAGIGTALGASDLADDDTGSGRSD